MKMKLKTVFATFLLVMPVLMSSCQRTETANYPDGTKKFELNKNHRGELNGPASWWYPNGKLMLTADYADGVINGLLVRYHENGNKQYEDQYVSGEQEGFSREYNANGKLIAEYTYTGGKKNGLCRIYNEGGGLLEEGNYRDDLWDGTWQYYDRFGKVTGIGEYVSGKGVRKQFSFSGTLAAYTEYENNVRHGREVYYDEQERPIRERVYDAGEMVFDKPIVY
jgi:antitoxin component YwqK of YwqJK toxin-antitoxin module